MTTAMVLLAAARTTFQRFVSSESAGGFALMAAAGDTVGAIRAYEAAVRLDPGLPGAADKLRALRGDRAPRAARPRVGPTSH